MGKEKKAVIPVDFVQEYNNLFKLIGVDPNKLNHQWKKDGDLLKEFSLEETLPTPIITQETFSINY